MRNMNEEQYAQIRADLARNEKEHESYNRRLREHDETLKELGKNQVILERLTNAVNNLTSGMTDLKTAVHGMEQRVISIEQEPAGKWKKITYEVLKWAIIGILGFAAGAAMTLMKGA